MAIDLEDADESRVREIVEGVLDRALQEMKKKGEPDADFIGDLADLGDQLSASGEFDLDNTHRGQTAYRVGFIAYSLDALATIRLWVAPHNPDRGLTPHQHLQMAEAHLKAAIEAQLEETRRGLQRWQDGEPPLPERRDVAPNAPALSRASVPAARRGRHL